MRSYYEKLYKNQNIKIYLNKLQQQGNKSEKSEQSQSEYDISYNIIYHATNDSMSWVQEQSIICLLTQKCINNIFYLQADTKSS